MVDEELNYLFGHVNQPPIYNQKPGFSLSSFSKLFSCFNLTLTLSHQIFDPTFFKKLWTLRSNRRIGPIFKGLPINDFLRGTLQNLGIAQLKQKSLYHWVICLQK